MLVFHFFGCVPAKVSPRICSLSRPEMLALSISGLASKQAVPSPRYEVNPSVCLALVRFKLRALTIYLITLAAGPSCAEVQGPRPAHALSRGAAAGS